VTDGRVLSSGPESWRFQVESSEVSCQEVLRSNPCVPCSNHGWLPYQLMEITFSVRMWLNATWVGISWSPFYDIDIIFAAAGPSMEHIAISFKTVKYILLTLVNQVTIFLAPQTHFVKINTCIICNIINWIKECTVLTVCVICYRSCPMLVEICCV